LGFYSQRQLLASLKTFLIVKLIYLQNTKNIFIIVITDKSQWTIVFIGIMIMINTKIIGRVTIVFL